MNLMTYPLFIMPGLGMGELVILFLIILIIFGPGKLPDVMRSLGEGVRQFKNATKELTSDHKPAEPKPTEVTPENKSV